jgi:diaminopimelate decarboxylase
MNQSATARGWGGIPAAQWHSLAETHGTPFYLYDADVVTRRIESVRAALQGRISIYYAVKANPNLGVLRALRTVADGVDISSAGELSQARLAGFDSKRMSFAGPAKTSAELERAIDAQVGGISVESVREIEACASIAQRLGRKASILLRVNPSSASRSYGLKMGGRAVQFGVDEEEPLRSGDVHSIAFVLGSLSRHPLLCRQPVLRSLGDRGVGRDGTSDRIRAGARDGLHCATINLGGGFGVSHGEEPRELDLAALSSVLLPLVAAHDARERARSELIFELGRYLTAPAGIYVSRVVGRKTSRGKTFVTCDGGLHHHLAAAGTFGAALRSNFALCNLTSPDRAPIVCSIAGPSCNPTDLLGVDARVPDLLEGDLLGVLMSGSYGLTASPVLFLGRPTAVELVKEGTQISVGRRRFDVTEFN